MNLNLNAEQFVELYSSLVDRQHPVLQDLKQKMKSSLIETLSNVDEASNQNKFPQWFKKEKEKILDMENQLKSIGNVSDDGLFAPPAQEKR